MELGWVCLRVRKRSRAAQLKFLKFLWADTDSNLAEPNPKQLRGSIHRSWGEGGGEVFIEDTKAEQSRDLIGWSGCGFLIWESLIGCL